MKNPIRVHKVDASVVQWYHEAFLNQPLMYEVFEQYGVDNLEDFAIAYRDRYRANLRKAKLNKGFGKKEGAK